jgi:hypothetical protein
MRDRLRRWEILVGAFVLAATLVLALDTKIGPVVFKFGAGHGVHLGDLVVAVPVGTLATWRWRRTRSAPPHTPDKAHATASESASGSELASSR